MTGDAGAAGVAGLTPVDLSPERIQLMGMRTASVTRESRGGELRALGTITASEKGLARVETRFAGWVETLAVAETGTRVKRGQLLATVTSPDLAAAQQEFLLATTWSRAGALPDSPTVDLAGPARGRLALLGLTAGDIARLEKTRTPLRTLEVRSPAAGVVTRRSVVEGSYVQPGSELFEIADLSTVWVLADIYEHDLARVSEGQPAQLELAAYPGERFAGKVGFLSPTVDPQSRTLRIRLTFKNPDLRLRPGLYGNVVLTLPPTEGLFVPREAVVDTGAARYLFVAQPGGRFEPRKVKLGARAGDRVQVTEGVHEGEIVVTTANFLLDSESRLRSAIEGGAAPPAHEGH
jgi:Cu(I)/Ag(I) efflux system membrane fusion protein